MPTLQALLGVQDLFGSLMAVLKSMRNSTTPLRIFKVQRHKGLPSEYPRYLHFSLGGSSQVLITILVSLVCPYLRSSPFDRDVALSQDRIPARCPDFAVIVFMGAYFPTCLTQAARSFWEECREPTRTGIPVLLHLSVIDVMRVLDTMAYANDLDFQPTYFAGVQPAGSCKDSIASLFRLPLPELAVRHLPCQHWAFSLRNHLAAVSRQTTDFLPSLLPLP